jgi:hypothetical protein
MLKCSTAICTCICTMQQYLTRFVSERYLGHFASFLTNLPWKFSSLLFFFLFLVVVGRGWTAYVAEKVWLMTPTDCICVSATCVASGTVHRVRRPCHQRPGRTGALHWSDVSGSPRDVAFFASREQQKSPPPRRAVPVEPIHHLLI